jgi:hypothetical protein
MEDAIELAELIAQILGEGVYSASPRKVRLSTILLTAGLIQQAIEKGEIISGSGVNWNPDFVEDFGGLIDEELDENWVTATSYSVTATYE